MGTLKPGSHHEVLRSVCPRLCGPSRPADDAAAVAPLVYGLPYGALAAPGYALPYAAPHVAYAHAPVVYNALDSGLVYPLAEPYVHDATGDVADDAPPEAEAYVHDATGDVSEPYVHEEPVPVVAAPAVTYAAYPYTYGAYPYLAAGAHVVAAPAAKVEVKATAAP